MLCNNRRFRSDSEDNSEGRHVFSPLLVFYSIIISRVLKITVECRFIDDFSQTEIDLVLKNIDLCVAKKIKFCHFIYVVFNFLLKYFPLLYFRFPCLFSTIVFKVFAIYILSFSFVVALFFVCRDFFPFFGFLFNYCL